jgi:glycosyltransferase involved in cell wall biosynthesis
VEALVPAAELASRVAEHDIGLALEDSSIPSRNLSVSNKVFHYLQSGLAIVATPTAGQREILSRCGAAGRVLPATTPGALAEALDCYLGNPEFLARAKSAAREASQRLFPWKEEEAKLVAAAHRALEIEGLVSAGCAV